MDDRLPRSSAAQVTLPADKIPAVSVIIPVFNARKYLGECLDSVFSQTFQNFEIILVNDGSTDDTGVIIDQYRLLYPNKMIAVTQKNGGPSKARNRGMMEARGEYLSFVDADDALAPDFLELLVREAKTSGAQVVSSGFIKRKNGKTVFSSLAADWDVKIDGSACSLMTVVWTRLYKKDFLLKYNLRFYENELFEDMAFCLCVNFLSDKIISIPLQGYYYSVREESIMSRAKKGLIGVKQLPTAGLEAAFIQIKAEISPAKIRAFEFAAVKALAGLLFWVLRKNDKETIRTMSDYSARVMKLYFPDVMSNPSITLFKVRNLPFVQRFAMVIFKFACRLRVLYPMAYLITRF